MYRSPVLGWVRHRIHHAFKCVAPDAMGIDPNSVSSGRIFRRAVQRTRLVDEIFRVARVDSPVTAAVPDRKGRPRFGMLRSGPNDLGKLVRSRPATKSGTTTRSASKVMGLPASLLLSSKLRGTP